MSEYISEEWFSSLHRLGEPTSILEVEHLTTLLFFLSPSFVTHLLFLINNFMILIHKLSIKIWHRCNINQCCSHVSLSMQGQKSSNRSSAAELAAAASVERRGVCSLLDPAGGVGPLSLGALCVRFFNRRVGGSEVTKASLATGGHVCDVLKVVFQRIRSRRLQGR